MKIRGDFLAGGAAALLLSAASIQAKEGSPWIHIRVTEHNASQSKVSVNLPLSVVQVALDVAPEKIVSNGRIRIDHHGHHDLSIADLRRLWRELKESGEAEYVSIEQDDERVAVTREGDLIRIEVVPSDKDGETIHIKVPISLVDAILSGEGEELNIGNAMEELKDQRGEIVRIEGGDADVRIWIDERS